MNERAQSLDINDQCYWSLEDQTKQAGRIRIWPGYWSTIGRWLERGPFRQKALWMKAVKKKKWHIPKNEETGLVGKCQRIEVKKNQKGKLKIYFLSMRTAGNKEQPWFDEIKSTENIWFKSSHWK